MTIEVGNVCRNNRGELGVVTKVIIGAYPMCHGMGFDGYEWESINPQFIEKNIMEYINTYCG
jgi:hypothetical protein